MSCRDCVVDSGAAPPWTIRRKARARDHCTGVRSLHQRRQGLGPRRRSGAKGRPMQAGMSTFVKTQTRLRGHCAGAGRSPARVTGPARRGRLCRPACSLSSGRGCVVIAPAPAGAPPASPARHEGAACAGRRVHFRQGAVSGDQHQGGDRHQAGVEHPGTLDHQPVPGPVSGAAPGPVTRPRTPCYVSGLNCLANRSPSRWTRSVPPLKRSTG